MAVIVKSTVYPGHYPVVYRHAEVLPGGYRIKNALPKGYMIPRGAYVEIKADKLEANICKVGQIIGGGSDTAIRVAKGHPFEKGDFVMLSGKKQSKTIQSIDSSHPDYDVLTVDAALTGASAGVLVEAKAAHDTSAAPKFIPNGFVDREKEYKDGDTCVSVGCRGILIHGSIPVPAEFVDGIHMKNNANVLIVSQ